jgi:hypothetical protein
LTARKDGNFLKFKINIMITINTQRLDTEIEKIIEQANKMVNFKN